MILVLKQKTTNEQIQSLADRLRLMGFHPVVHRNSHYTSIAVVNGMDQNTRPELFNTLPQVEKVMPFKTKYKLVGKDVKHEKTIIDIKGRKIGDDEFIVMAGPCSVESKEQIFAIAKAVSEQGATFLRGGAFKPRTSPYDFQGLGEEGLRYMHDAAKEYHLLTVSEVMTAEDVDLVAKYMDVLQIGARNMQNFNLLKRVGQCETPILLKRGLSATYNEFLLAAEYILAHGNPNVILCERGIRSYETYSRNTLDIAAVPILKELTHLPIIVDPSHGTGLRSIVSPMARAAIAVEADGLMVEVHTDPDNALTDAQQTISTGMFVELMTSLRNIGSAMRIRVK